MDREELVEGDGGKLISIYEREGYKNRKDYLENLAVENGIPKETVFLLADLLGPNEDFDGLVTALEDMEEIDL